MAETNKGIYYPGPEVYEQDGDVPGEMKKLAESVDKAIPTKVSELEQDCHDDTKQNTTDEFLQTTNKNIVDAINEVNNIAKGAGQALSYANYQAMITTFNALGNDKYNIGQNIYIGTLEVPDLWISSIESTSSSYIYTTDEAFTTALETNGYVQVGYYRLRALETQKVDLTGKQDEIDENHKLSSDLVDDTGKTHKFITEQERNNWNNKEKKHTTHRVVVTEEIKALTEYELPCSYTVGNDSLVILYNNERLICEKSEGDDANYKEVGQAGETSNKVIFGWDIPVGRIFDFIVKGEQVNAEN